MKLDTRLKALRLANNLTQRQLSARLGISVSAVSSYELGNNNPPYDVLISYADIFHVTTDFILGRESSNTSMVSVDGLTAKEIKAVQALVDHLREK